MFQNTLPPSPPKSPSQLTVCSKQMQPYGSSSGIPLNILVIYGKDPNFQMERWYQLKFRAE